MLDVGLEDIGRFLKKGWQLRYDALSLPQKFRGLKLARAASRSPLSIDYLKSRYPALSFFTCNGWTFPVVLFPNPFPLEDIRNNPLVTLDQNWKPAIKASSKAYYWLMRAKAGVDDRPTFILKDFSAAPKLKLTCGVASFFSVMQTSFALEWEFLNVLGAAASKNDWTVDEINRRLKLRNRLEMAVKDPIISGEGRSAGIGLSALLAFRRGSSVELWLKKRGQMSMETDIGKWHVIPAGMFQAPFKEYDIECSVLHGIMWEFLEELFDVADPVEQRRDPKWFYSQPPIAEFRKMLDKGIAHVWLTGVAVNPLYLRPEILLTIFIDDKNWAIKHEIQQGGAIPFHFNKEFAQSRDVEGFESPMLRATLAETPDEIFARHNLVPSSIVPVAAACLYSGVNALNQHLH